MRASPDKDFEPAFRGSPSAYNEEYTRILAVRI